MSSLSPYTATTNTVPSTASSVTLFSAATGYLNGRSVYNSSTAVLYLTYGTAATTTSVCTTSVGTMATYVFPQPVYSGTVTGIWASANGTATTTQW